MFQDFAVKTVKETHTFWKALISKNTNAGELNWSEAPIRMLIYAHRTYSVLKTFKYKL